MKCKDKSSGNTGAIVTIIGLGVAAITGGLKLSQESFDSFDQSFPQSETFIDRNSRELIANLKGDWKFATGDDMLRADPDFDDSTWGEIEVPDSWESEGYSGYDGFAWYRQSFSISRSDTNKPLYAILGQIDDADEAFVNGIKIGGKGRFPPNTVSAWNKDRIYRIPPGVVTPGTNKIAVRVYDATQAGGISRGRVGIFASTLPQPLVDLSGEWKFSTENKAEFADEEYDDSSFSKIRAPEVWEDDGFDDYNGHAWYRKTFTLPQNQYTESMALLLGKIDDTDEVFLNGQKIGNTGTLQNSDLQTNRDYYDQPRLYSFSGSLLKETNTIAVHVHDSGGLGGIYAGPLGIMSQSDHDLYLRAVAENSKFSFSDTWDWLMGKKQ